MALTIIEQPFTTAISPVRNNLQIKLQTDNYLTSAPESPSVLNILVKLSAADPLDGDNFVIQLNGLPFTFTFKTTPALTGYELPLKGAYSTSEYKDELIFYIQGAPCFIDGWKVNAAVVGSDINIGIMSHPGYLPGSVTSVSNATILDYTNTAGNAPVFRPNFTNNIRLMVEEIYGSNDFINLIEKYHFPIEETSGNYFSYFKIDEELYDFMRSYYMKFLDESLPRSANFPNANHLIKRFRFQYYEYYGNPSVPQFSKFSEIFHMALYGIGRLSFVSRPYLYGLGLLHPGKNIDNQQTLTQYVQQNQPAWMYFYFFPNDGNDMFAITAVQKKIYYTDGTTATTALPYTISLFAVPHDNCKAFFIPAGYNQQNIGAGDTSTKKAYAWDIIVEIDENDAYLTRKFVLDAETLYSSYLMYQNSYGGYDTIAITAPREFGLDVTDGKEVERFVGATYQKFESQFEAGTPNARQSVKAKIGFKKNADYDAYKELLMSKHVFAIPKGSTDTFIPVNLDRKSVTLHSEDDMVRTFSIEFSPAFEFKNFENSLWLE